MRDHKYYYGGRYDRHNPPAPPEKIPEPKLRALAYCKWLAAGSPQYCGNEKRFWDEAFKELTLIAWAKVYDTRPR